MTQEEIVERIEVSSRSYICTDSAMKLLLSSLRDAGKSWEAQDGIPKCQGRTYITPKLSCLRLSSRASPEHNKDPTFPKEELRDERIPPSLSR